MLLLDESPRFLWQHFINKPLSEALHPLISADTELNIAYDWLQVLYQQHNLDAHWHLPCDWADFREKLQQSLLAQSYQFQAPHLIEQDQQQILLWSLSDTLVLRSLAQVFSKHLSDKPALLTYNYSEAAAQAMVAPLFESIQQYLKVYPDAYAYVAHLEFNAENRAYNRQLCRLLSKYISLEPSIQTLLSSYLAQSHQFSYRDTLFDPFAPLLSQLLLKVLDEQMQNQPYFYARHVGEWLLLAPDKAQLEHAIQLSEKCLKKSGLKRYISPRAFGSLNWGINFLGFNLNPHQIERYTLAHEKRDTHLLWCYQQHVDEVDIEHYLSCWQRWVDAGLSNCPGFDEKVSSYPKKKLKIIHYLQQFLLWCAWMKMPLLIILNLSIGIFLGDFLIEILDDTLDLANHFERFMNPRYW